jgi:hypothetical protein
MQDGAPAIFNAVNKILKPQKALSCWFHVKQALHKKKQNFPTVNEESYRYFISLLFFSHLLDVQLYFFFSILGKCLFLGIAFSWCPEHRHFAADVDKLHAAQTETEFHEGATLFVKKWKAINQDMVNWFDDEYFGWRQNFYACCSPPGIPATNNSQECFHNLLKKDGSARKRLACGAFLHCMKEELHNLSHPLEHGGEFQACFAISNQEWRNAQQWAKKSSQLTFSNKKGACFIVASNSLAEKR